MQSGQTHVNGWRGRIFNRRTFLGACGLGVAGAGYLRLAESEWLEANELKLPLTREGQEIRILHLSDFHASDVVSLKYIRRAVELGLSLKPDLICLTGDFITLKYDDFAGYTEVIKLLGKAAPAFACIGNHDGGSWIARRHNGYKNWSLIAEMLKAGGVKTLNNAREIVEINGHPVQLVGLGDLWASELNPTLAFYGAHRDLKTICMAHNPDSKEFLGDFRWNLLLSGHTHGGQMWIPFIGAPFAPVRDKRYVSGLKPWRDRWIHVTKGVGNLHGLRLNCRPEVSLLRVTI